MLDITFLKNSRSTPVCHGILVETHCNIVNMLIAPKFIYRLNAISIKISIRFYTNLGKIILKLVCEGKGTRITKNNFENNKKLEVINLPNFKTRYVAPVIKIMWY